MSLPIQIAPSFVEKVWGSTHLEPLFRDEKRKIGEVHFQADPKLAILVKFIFTTEKLSVQVHPKGATGKTEMWQILRAEPGATIALGFRRPVSRDELRQASLYGEVEQLLRWYPVKEGETYFVPAGTVHAIGAGISLCEIQQNNDVTYRLYDYGRPRELHLDQGLPVADLSEHQGTTKLPVQCPYFTVEARNDQPLTQEHQVIFLGGPRRGEVWLVPAGADRPDTESVAALRAWGR